MRLEENARYIELATGLLEQGKRIQLNPVYCHVQPQSETMSDIEENSAELFILGIQQL